MKMLKRLRVLFVIIPNGRFFGGMILLPEDSSTGGFVYVSSETIFIFPKEEIERFGFIFYISGENIFPNEKTMSHEYFLT